MWNAIRKVLGVLTDILTLGRSAGLWNKDHTVMDSVPKADKKDIEKK